MRACVVEQWVRCFVSFVFGGVVRGRSVVVVL